MVEHHELSVGSEAVVTLVGQTGAVLPAVLGPGWDVDRSVRDISWVVDPGLESYVECRSPPKRQPHSLPVVVCLPAGRIKHVGVGPGAVIEGHRGPQLDVFPGKESLTGALYPGLLDRDVAALVGIRSGGI